MIFTTVFEKNTQAYLDEHRIIINQGGTRSGKTFAILQLLLTIAVTHQNKIISVVTGTLPQLKRGAIRDFKHVVEGFGISWNKNYNKSEQIFHFNNSIIEFFGVEDDQKVKGPARDILFINEADRISFDTFRQLAQRTRETIFIDFNPVKLFWVNTEIIQKREHHYIHSTYNDNIEFLSEAQIKEIEENKSDENWWRIYGLGLMGFSEDLVFPAENLKYFEMSEINIAEADTIVAYIDTADRGSDFLSMPIGAVFGRYVYIFDVLYNDKLLGINETLATEIIKRYNIEHCVIEVNKEGSYFIGKMQELNPYVNFMAIFNTKSDGKKMARIMAQAHFVLDRMIFRKDIQKNFLFNVTNFSQSGKNEHDDAPDSIAGLAKFCKNYLQL